MANEEKKEKQDLPVLTTIPIAKRHTLLLDIQKQINGHELDTTAEVAGHKFYMTTINSDEEMWSDGLMQTDSTPQAVSSFRKSRLACAIKAIDDVKVEDMFDYPDDLSEAVRQQFESSKYGKRTWEMQQLYVWLGELPMSVIDDLAIEYQKISRKRKETLDELKNSSTRTSGGTSKDMSSPEKEFSSQTQQSEG